MRRAKMTLIALDAENACLVCLPGGVGSADSSSRNTKCSEKRRGSGALTVREWRKWSWDKLLWNALAQHL